MQITFEFLSGDCGGRMPVKSQTSRAKKGGTVSYLKSLELGQMTMEAGR